MSLIMNHLNLVIALLGGTGAIVASALRGVKPLVKWGIRKATSDPKWSSVLLNHRVEIEAFFDDVDAALKESLDSEAEKNKTNPTSAK